LQHHTGFCYGVIAGGAAETALRHTFIESRFTGPIQRNGTLPKSRLRGRIVHFPEALFSGLTPV
jgi:hypothetical protein